MAEQSATAAVVESDSLQIVALNAFDAVMQGEFTHCIQWPDEKQKAFEAKFAHDEQVTFKVTARRNKLLALWAAEQMGKPADALDEYVKEVISSDFEEAGDEDVVRKVAGDMEAAGSSVSADDIRAKLGDLMIEAKTQVMGEMG